ncbi:MAG: TetR/AcrR family transcriptional regulator [Asgard group archaeon]|nr:TetR/AcrR family transcriptional regulator [Asgard group archaeon]
MQVTSFVYLPLVVLEFLLNQIIEEFKRNSEKFLIGQSVNIIKLKPSDKRLIKSIQTRENILEIATELFFKQGFTDVSTDMIAKQANVSKGSIFHHFKSKEDLGLAVLRKTMSIYNEIIPALEQEMDPEMIIKIFIEETMKISSSQPGFIKMLMWFLIRLDEEGKDEIFYQKIKDTFLDVLLPFSEAVEKLFEKLGHKNARIKSIILMGMLDGISIYLSYIERLSKIEPKLLDYLKDFNLLPEIIIELFFPKKD